MILGGIVLAKVYMYKVFVFIIVVWGCYNCSTPEWAPVEIAERLAYCDVDSAWNMLNRMERIFSGAEEKARFALLYTELQYRKQMFVESDSLLREAWNYYAAEGGVGYAWANYYLGRVYSDRDSAGDAVRYLVDAEQYALKERNYMLLGRIYNELGKLHSSQYIITEALEHYRKAEYYSSLARDSLNESYALGNIAKCFLHLNCQDSAWNYCIQALDRADRRRDTSFRVHLEEYFAYFYLCKEEMPPLRVLDDTVTFGKFVVLADRDAVFRPDTNGEAYLASLRYRRKMDSVSVVDSRKYVFKVEDKYRNQHLMDRNGVLESNNYRKTITLVVLLFLVVGLILVALLIIFHHRKVVKEKSRVIEEYTGLIEALREEHELSKNSLMEKLNEKNEKEAVLKMALNKRLGIIRQLTDLSFKYGEGNKSKDIFCRKVKELMCVDILTQDMLADLLEVTNLNYYGIIDILKAEFGLSKEELELCSFVCAGFTPQEMSVLYNVNVNNVYVRCSRLGKKMGLPVSLSSYLKETLRKLADGFHENEIEC